MSPDEVEEAARRYVPGVGAVSVERLGRGLVNESHRVRRDGRMYSMRLPAGQRAARQRAAAQVAARAATHVPIGVDREWECRVLAAASAAGIAPLIECCEPRLGVLVARWQEGHTLSAEEARRPETGARVAELVRRVHALPLPANARVLYAADWIERYRGVRAPRTQDRAADALLKAEAVQRLAALEAAPRGPAVLCHSDLHPANLVVAERGLILLDWEYAHVSEGLWDIAGWACNNDLDPAARALLLASYLGRPVLASEERRLENLGWLYDYVCLLWSEVYCGASDAPDARVRALILERGRVLAARLARRAGGGPGELPAN